MDKLKQIPHQDLRKVRAAVRKPAIQKPRTPMPQKPRQIPKRMIREFPKKVVR